MNYSGRDQFFESAERRYRDVDCDEWGIFRIQSLTELERSKCENSFLDKEGNVDPARRLEIKPRYIIAAVVDDAGNRLFTAAEIDRIQACDSKLTNKLVDAIMEHCGITEKDIDVAEKNSEPTGSEPQLTS